MTGRQDAPGQLEFGRPWLQVRMSMEVGDAARQPVARTREIDCVLVWKFDRFAHSTHHLLMTLEEFDHLGGRFVRAHDQV
jgi:hypothetical protein